MITTSKQIKDKLDKAVENINAQITELRRMRYKICNIDTDYLIKFNIITEEEKIILDKEKSQ